jgi:hypothetical protein
VLLVALAAGAICVAAGATIERSVHARIHNEGKVPGRLVVWAAVVASRSTVMVGLADRRPRVWTRQLQFARVGCRARLDRHDDACVRVQPRGHHVGDPASGDFDSRRGAQDLRAAWPRAEICAVGDGRYSVGAAYVMTYMVRSRRR